jgi:hypothetical protein
LSSKAVACKVEEFARASASSACSMPRFSLQSPAPEEEGGESASVDTEPLKERSKALTLYDGTDGLENDEATRQSRLENVRGHEERSLTFLSS